MIKFDLHIHSYASKYKESDGIVDDSTENNLYVLFDKLIQNDIKLFSITDHNRFDVELYLAVDKYIEEHYVPISIVSGVEFDVLIEEDKIPCHIITIFNTNNDILNYKKIENEINRNKKVGIKEYYSKNEFNILLSEIKLDVLLIANQQSDLYNTSCGRTRSLSDSCENPEELIRYGYISALEFQKNKVEGILLNNLKNLEKHIGLVSGSDCHTWECYPQHDKTRKARDSWYSEAQILPTFKGLLMAFSSPDTRFNRYTSSQSTFIESIEINKKVINLTKGINVIIGENGSGKSTFLDIIYDNSNLQKFEKKIKADNDIKVKKNDSCSIKYINQNKIINSYHDKKLLREKANFEELDHTDFISKYTNFANRIYNIINKNIDLKSSYDKLKSAKIEIQDFGNITTYYIHAKTVTSNFTEIDNFYNNDSVNLKLLIEKIRTIKQSNNLVKFYTSIDEIEIKLQEMLEYINKKYYEKEYEIKLRNIIYNKIDDYNSIIKSKEGTKSQALIQYNSDIFMFNKKITDYLRKNLEDRSFPIIPKNMSNIKTNSLNGFEFQNVALYDDNFCIEDFYKYLFVKNYQAKDQLLEINTMKIFSEAVKNCSDKSNIQKVYNVNINKFINDYTTDSYRYIQEISAKEKIGNTLGELSLAYIKFICQENDIDVLLLDQPEDNISNKKIGDSIIKLLNENRSREQMIIVTHNPLLVVNLDADNVICLKKINDEIKVVSGALEYEDEDVNILNTIAETMDGGMNAIEKRLKVYECNYKNEKE